MAWVVESQGYENWNQPLSRFLVDGEDALTSALNKRRIRVQIDIYHFKMVTYDFDPFN